MVGAEVEPSSKSFIGETVRTRLANVLAGVGGIETVRLRRRVDVFRRGVARRGVVAKAEAAGESSMASGAADVVAMSS